jgi:hypothetical protein
VLALTRGHICILINIIQRYRSQVIIPNEDCELDKLSEMLHILESSLVSNSHEAPLALMVSRDLKEKFSSLGHPMQAYKGKPR